MAAAYNEGTGVIRLEGATVVRKNTASLLGGGILNVASEGAKIEEVSFTGSVTKNQPENIYIQ
jgi:hypothetical protein